MSAEQKPKAQDLSLNAADLLARFELDAAALAQALNRLAAEQAVSLPLLGSQDQALFTRHSESLPYREARPVIGKDGREVFQDFELSVTFPEDSPFWVLTAALEQLITEALSLLSSSPLSADFRLNDLIVQRYEAGCKGITPHRDHVRYRDLVALVTLSGECRFFICSDRDGRDSREVAMPAGSLVLLTAPDFDGGQDRPFHHLPEVLSRRVSVGLRYDVRPGEPL